MEMGKHCRLTPYRTIHAKFPIGLGSQKRHPQVRIVCGERSICCALGVVGAFFGEPTHLENYPTFDEITPISSNFDIPM